MEQQDSLWKDSFSYGLILGVILIAYTLILYAAGLSFEEWAGYPVYIFMFAVIFWSTLQYRNKFLGGYSTYGKSWKIGTVISIYAGIGDLPEIKEAELQLQSAETSLTIAKGNYSPELSASAGIYSGYSSARQHAVGDPVFSNQTIGVVEESGATVVAPYPNYNLETIPMGTQLSDNLSQQVGLTLRIPIYSQGRIRQQTSNAKIGILDAKNNIELVKRNVYKSVQQAHVDAQAALARYRSSKTSVEALEKAFEYTEQRFNVGAVNTLEYNQAKNNLFKSQADLTQAKYDYIFRLKILDFYRGKPLKL